MRGEHSAERLRKAAVSKALREAADLDGNRRIDYSEWVFFDTLLRVPLRDIELTFRLIDEDDSGTLDAEELRAALERVSGTAQAPLRVKALFGASGKKKVTLQEFRAWYERVRREVALLEFQVLDDDGDGRMAAEAFGRAVVGEGGQRFARQLGELRDEDAELAFEDYWAFLRVAEQMKEVDEAVRLFLASGSDGAVSRTRFRRAVLATTGVALSEAVVETLFVLFGTEGGRLSTARLADHLRQRAAGGGGGGAEGAGRAGTDKPSLPRCVADCFGSEIVRRESVLKN